MSERGSGATTETPHRRWLRTALLVVAALALIAVGAAVVDLVQGPSDSECRTQRMEVMSGDREAVEDACR